MNRLMLLLRQWVCYRSRFGPLLLSVIHVFQHVARRLSPDVATESWTYQPPELQVEQISVPYKFPSLWYDTLL
jgi:hypothetical protein